MFSIEQKLMKIRSVTTVAEFKGDGREHAQNVKLEWTTDNGVLAEFDPQLRSAFYQKEDGKQKSSDDGQGEFTMPLPDVELTKLRIPFLQMPVKFKKDFVGYQMVYHCGASDKSNITLSDVQLSDFSFDMKDGGTVLVVFNAYAKPNAADQGKIDQMMQTEIEITLAPPEVKQTDFVDQANKAKKPNKKTAAEKVETEGDPFANTDIPPLAEETAGEQKSRDGVAWPFPQSIQ
ncbi:hypothetical protein FSO04_24355 [Paraburkholderia madseniana]|uniref:Uncharacterized protein n=1 Tax=Paraburkholderia madseniana TaxID=2599607 RepID=A0A6N6W9M0_9BURK|nr:hypothetical protein [Paraburkholderia madseniana]KAE8757355.1 hypothetical protein FSO04_24355 [Paraburkholderia madseniana]